MSFPEGDAEIRIPGIASPGRLGYASGMQAGYDVVIIGGAFSGASAALLLRREHPGLRVLIVERSEHFDRKVGEATTEISGCFLTKRLSFTHHLTHSHVPKHGLRFWFNQNPDDAFADCGELGGVFQTRLPTFQVDREVLDQYVLDQAVEAGAELWRPAKISQVDIREDGGPSLLRVRVGAEEREVSARWVIDASGRAAVLARKFGFLKPLTEHPTNAMWARFRNVKDWDGHDLRSRFSEYAGSCQVSRASATNHLAGYGWWCWIIPLRGGDYSAGLVYDQRLFTPPAGATLAERLKTHLLNHPVGREIFGDAEVIPGDVKAYSSLPYYAEKIAGPGWQIVGDAAGFMDPLYSQGLDYCSWTVSSVVNRIADESMGKEVCLKDLNARWMRSYRGWFEGLYKDKYHYLGDKELMSAAFLMDLGLFFFGPVRSVVRCVHYGFGRFPFDGPVDGVVGRLMAFYNRRLSRIAQKRKAAGVYGAMNLRHRKLIKGFDPTPKALRVVWMGAKIWLRAELRSAFLPAPKKEPRIAPQPASVVS